MCNNSVQWKYTSSMSAINYQIEQCCPFIHPAILSLICYQVASGFITTEHQAVDCQLLSLENQMYKQIKPVKNKPEKYLYPLQNLPTSPHTHSARTRSRTHARTHSPKRVIWYVCLLPTGKFTVFFSHLVRRTTWCYQSQWQRQRLWITSHMSGVCQRKTQVSLVDWFGFNDSPWLVNSVKKEEKKRSHIFKFCISLVHLNPNIHIHVQYIWYFGEPFRVVV